MPTPISRLPASAYSRAADPRPIDLRLDANEGAGPTPEFLDVLRPSRDAVMSYPSARALEAEIASDEGIAPERVIVTAGADDALERICRAYLEPGREVILTDPTFEMLPRFSSLCGADIRAATWRNGPYPLARAMELLSPRTAAVFVVSPNNPTGLTATEADVRTLCEAAPDAIIVLDHAYIEFADEDIGPKVRHLPNLVITRTFSKAWGLAGLRIGYAEGPAAVIHGLRSAGLPYTTSGLSLEIVRRWRREGRSATAAFISGVRRERALLIECLRGAGAECSDSQGNFVFARFRDAAFTADCLAGLGIAVRRYGGALADSLRITVPADPASGERLRAALRAALRPRAVLFDMDGVLADVSNSYREAVIRTCAALGAAITRDEVAAAKRRGNANNDWVLSRDLLAARGIEKSLAEVTRVFEDIYQGTPGRPGLRAAERLLIPRERLLALSRRVPLAIVTGRPRADADRFLREHGIADCFSHVLCMEDGPSKPDPAIVRDALDRLGVREAWMIGDTRDDITAARGAGVVPLGIIAPSDEAAITTDTLLRAGAARVLIGIDQLPEVPCA